MHLINRLQEKEKDFDIEIITDINLNRYEDVFYSNNDYYMLTDARPVTKQDCVDTINYRLPKVPQDNIYCIGFSFNNKTIAILSLLEGFPEETTLYLGLFLVKTKFKRNGFGSKIILNVIKQASEIGFDKFKLSVQDNNISGYSFWRKMGFSITEQKECNGFYNLSMEYKLSQ